MARYANRQSDEAQTFVIVCGFDSHPCYLNNGRLGIGEPTLAVTQSSSDCGGSTPSRRTSCGDVM